MRRTTVIVFLGISLLCACSKKPKDAPEAPPTSNAGSKVADPGVTSVTTQTPPADVPSFLDRFCVAVASGDQAYVTSHAEGTFSSDQAADPTKCGGRTGKRCFRKVASQHAEADFHPVCARIQAQPRAALAKSIREAGGVSRARLVEGDLVSDLIVERKGSDFRLLREVAPGKS